MIKNQIFYVDYVDKNMFKDSAIFELDGKNIPTKDKFFREAGMCFKFPENCEGIFARFLDWMTDLNWIKEEKFVLIIKNYSIFLEEDKEFKELVLKRFKNNILPFWEKEIETVVVGGKPKSFNVYIEN